MADRYEIQGKLARGGIGAIYRAQDKVMGRTVAVKRLLPIEETHLNEAADESLEREAAALARFQHPNVVTIYAFEEDDEGSYVVMELVDGENLKETVERGALPVDDFKEITLQTLDPLIAAKEMNLMHRDIKPSNIMLTVLPTGRFQIKILDFGLAKFSQAPSTQTLDQTGSFLGSIDYLAPEQLELEPLDQRTDLYSLGCVLYFCLTQRPPFEGKNAAETMSNHLKHKVTPLHEYRSDVPKPISDWVMRMISRYPKQRPADARAALKEFQGALDGISVVHSDGDEPAVEVVEDDPPTSNHPTPQSQAPAAQAGESSPARKPKLLTGNDQPLPRSSAASRRSKSRSAAATKGKKDQMEELKVPLMALAAAVVSAIVVLIVLFGQRGGDGEETESSSQASTPTSPSSAPEPQKPKAKNTGKSSRKNQAPGNPKTKPKTAPPPVTEGLIAHYSAAEWTTAGKDFNTTPGNNQPIRAWGNLAQGAASGHILAIPVNTQGEGPRIQVADPKNHSELNKKHPVLRFGAGGRLASQNRNDVSGKFDGTGLTLVLVFRKDSNNGEIFRISTDSEPKASLGLSITGQGRKLRSDMRSGDMEPLLAESTIGATQKKFSIFSLTWSGKEGTQNHSALQQGGKRISGSGQGLGSRQKLKPDRYSIGSATTAKNVFSGQVAEMLLYNRPLDDAERKEIEEHLNRKYFAKKPATGANRSNRP